MRFTIKEILEKTPEEILKLVSAGEIAEPIIIRVPLDNAVDNKQFNIAGFYFGIVDASDVNANVDIRFNRIDSNKINFTKSLYIKRPFTKFFLSCSAQSGKWVDIITTMFTPLHEIIDNRSEQLSTSYLQNIENNTSINPDIKTNTLVNPDIKSYLFGNVGTQIVKSNVASPNTTVIIHTVSSGKTLHLSLAWLDSKLDSTESGELFVRDDTDTEQYKLMKHYILSNYTNKCSVMPYPKPIKISAGWDICVKSNGAGTTCNAGISGWED